VAPALDVIRRHEAACAQASAPVLVHGDLGLHNLAFAPDDTVAGVFDYADAACADRHHDFRYLLFDTTDDTLLVSAIAAYRAAGGAAIDPLRVALSNAAAAIGFLADRRGHGPDDRPAGRTLAEDLAWTRLALSRLG
jgi:aminoglycoside phosphotransferase (APT) family kinase protein